MTGLLITGGAGTLGREIARHVHAQDKDQRIVIYSRDEGKQAAMAQELPEGGAAGMRYMLGDIRDTRRLCSAMAKCDTVIHAAAYKMIDRCEADAWEATSVNVDGTLSVAKACVECGIHRALLVSTDKAPNPVSTYGRTKALAEDIWTHGNCYGGTQFISVRYGNVIGSAKSAFHTWRAQADSGEPVTVTNDEATRFYWSITDAALFCLDTLCISDGDIVRGGTYIPHMRSYRIVDVAKTYSDNITITGFRCPEKVHEQLWTEYENQYVRSHGDRYCLYPSFPAWPTPAAWGTPSPHVKTSLDSISTWTGQ